MNLPIVCRWFEQTKSITANHALAWPYPNVCLAKRCKPFPIEFVVRAYITGSTDTSLWTHYKAGARRSASMMMMMMTIVTAGLTFRRV